MKQIINWRAPQRSTKKPNLYLISSEIIWSMNILQDKLGSHCYPWSHEEDSSKRRKTERSGKILKDSCERNIRSPILKATVTCPMTGVTTIIETQSKIIEAAKTEETDFRVTPLLQYFGYCFKHNFGESSRYRSVFWKVCRSPINAKFNT